MATLKPSMSIRKRTTSSKLLRRGKSSNVKETSSMVGTFLVRALADGFFSFKP